MAHARDDLESERGKGALERIEVNRPHVGTDGDNRDSHAAEGVPDFVTAPSIQGFEAGNGDLARRARHVDRGSFNQVLIRGRREQTPHKLVGCLCEIGAEGGKKLLEFFVGELLVERAKRIDQGKSDYPLRYLAECLADDVASHGVPDEHDPVEIEFFYDGCNVCSERGHGPFLAVKAGFAVTCEIDSHHLVLPAKVGRLCVPIGAVTRPAVHEHHRRLAGSLHVVTDGNSVG